MQLQKILNRTLEKYSSQNDFPCLYEQFLEFEKSKPFNGIKILHATPLFQNAITKILPIFAGGADLTVIPTPNLPFDQTAANFLIECGVTVRNHIEKDESFDLVLDCIGSFAHLNTKYGAVELTQSGEQYYLNSHKPCISVDRSKIKKIEDILGTSDGLIRALTQEKIDVKNKKVVLFGFGKVGRGCYLRLKKLGAHINIVEIDVETTKDLVQSPIQFYDSKRLLEVIEESDIVITATGVKEVLRNISKSVLINKNRTLINMGAEDEFGTHINKNEVINQKQPANFILDEPTQLKYLDAPFALQTYCALDLLKGDLKNGITPPRAETENKILATIEKNKTLYQEISSMGLKLF